MAFDARGKNTGGMMIAAYVNSSDVYNMALSLEKQQKYWQS